jgi:hypothetical protein
MPSSATIFVDDQDPNVKYLCPVLRQRVTGSYYKDTWTSPQNTSCGAGWFQYTFNGTGVHVAASFVNISDFPVRIDNDEFLLYTGNGSFDSPTLPDGQHTITYGMGNLTVFPALDYLTVTAGPNTSLYGKTISVDDNDKAMTFRGSWSQASPYPPSTPFDYASRLYQKTSHWTSNVGDTMQFNFQGSSVAVYGMVSYNKTSSRNITADFVVDGLSQTRTISNKTLPYLPMVELFRADLQDGNHTLLFNLTDIQGERALGIDFVAYNASFNHLTPEQPSSGMPAWAPKLGIALASIAGFAFLLTIGIIFWQRFRKDRHQGQKYVQTA